MPATAQQILGFQHDKDELEDVDESEDGSEDGSDNTKGIRVPCEFRKKDMGYILFHNDDTYVFTCFLK